MTPNPAAAALEKAQQIEAARTQRRLAVITDLATATQAIIDLRAQADARRAALETELRTLTDTATKDATKAWTAATTAGWTETDLRKAGFTNPNPKPRRKATNTGEPQATTPEPADQ